MKVLFASLALSLLQASAWACAGCRDPGSDVESATVMAGFGFSWGVIFMLLFVFSLCSGLGWFVVRTIKAVDARHTGGQ
jgi:hypothetical protein